MPRNGSVVHRAIPLLCTKTSGALHWLSTGCPQAIVAGAGGGLVMTGEPSYRDEAVATSVTQGCRWVLVNWCHGIHKM